MSSAQSSHSDSVEALLVPTESIVVIGKPFRIDYGDLDELADGIARAGLIHPLTVQPIEGGKYRLMAGFRRFRAVKDKLKWTHVAVRFSDKEPLLIEMLENAHRKDFTFSERMAIARAFEAKIERVNRGTKGSGLRIKTEDTPARPRRADDPTPLVGDDIKLPDDFPPPRRLPEGRQQDRRDYIAEQTGFGSGKTYEYAKKLAEHGSPELIQEVDEGKKSVSKAAKEATRVSQGKTPKAGKSRSSAEKNAPVHYDRLGKPLPVRLHDTFGGTKWPDIIEYFNATVIPALKAASWNKWLRQAEALGHAEALRDMVEATKPYAVHQACKGSGCDGCRGAGWLPEWKWEEEVEQSGGEEEAAEDEHDDNQEDLDGK